jgi:hypothetical protein
MDKIHARRDAEVVLFAAAAVAERIGIGDIILSIDMLHDAGVAKIGTQSAKLRIRQQRKVERIGEDIARELFIPAASSLMNVEKT